MAPKKGLDNFIANNGHNQSVQRDVHITMKGNKDKALQKWSKNTLTKEKYNTEGDV